MDSSVIASWSRAFEGLGAQWAVSAAFEDNAASLGVSRKLGYRDDGTERDVVRGRPPGSS
jgi:RimJ/RimL family protein N-acetyltransferase